MFQNGKKHLKLLIKLPPTFSVTNALKAIDITEINSGCRKKLNAPI